MTTYGNGEMLSRLIYEGTNKNYESRVAEYYSYHAYLKKDYFMRAENDALLDGEVPQICKPYPTNPVEFQPRRVPIGKEL